MTTAELKRQAEVKRLARDARPHLHWTESKHGVTARLAGAVVELAWWPERRIFASWLAESLDAEDVRDVAGETVEDALDKLEEAMRMQAALLAAGADSLARPGDDG